MKKCRFRFAPVALALSGLSSLFLLSACEFGQANEEQKSAVAAMALPFCLNEQCGVVDQDGKILVPFSTLRAFSIDRPDRYIVESDKGWQLRNLDGKVLLEKNGTFTSVGKGLFAIAENEGEYRLYSPEGKLLSNELFEYVYTGGADEYLVYEQQGRKGLLDLQGKKLTEAEFDKIYTNGTYYDLVRNGHFVLAEKAGKSWLIDARNGKAQPVPFDDMKTMRDGRMLVEQLGSEEKPETLYGLLDSQGKLSIGMSPRRLGEPANGLISFYDAASSRCGYLDFQGKEIIPARFDECEPFGKQLAFAKNPDNGKWGLIKRDGSWQGAQEWDYVYGAAYNLLGAYDATPGLATAFRGQVDYRATLFDTDSGKALTKGGDYKALGKLGKTLLTFGTADAQPGQFELMGQVNVMTGMGIMDRDEKVLVKSEGYAHFWVDPTGTVFTAQTPDKLTHVFNNTGKQIAIIAAPELQVHNELGVFFSFDADKDISRDNPSARTNIRGVYALDGRQLMLMRKLPCGAEQLLNGSNQPIWPEKPELYCPKAEQATKQE